MSIAFFFVFDFVLDYLLQFNDWLGLDPDPRISEWLGFVLILPIGFGLGFQLPLVMLFLERIGVFDVEAYVVAVADRGARDRRRVGDPHAGRSLQHAVSRGPTVPALLRRRGALPLVVPDAAIRRPRLDQATKASQ